MGKPIVIIESPFAGDVPKNVAYARAAVSDSLGRGEAPFASHLLYPQPGILDDDDATERVWGVEAGWEFMRVASRVAVYTDLGISPGMQAGIDRATSLGVPVERREVDYGAWEWACGGFFPAVPFLRYGEEVARLIRCRWIAKAPVIVREAMLALADQIERDDL